MIYRLSRLFSAMSIITALAGFMFASAPALGDETGDKVVAVVNGKSIYMDEVFEAVGFLAPEYQELSFEELYPHLVERLVTMRLLADDALKLELDKSDEYLRMFDGLLLQLQERIALSTEIRNQVTDEAVEAFYLDYVSKMMGKEELHVRHILLETRENALQAIADLVAGGDFAGIARERSTGPSAPQGGILDFFTRGQTAPAFEAAAYALEVGQFTRQPVETQFGWHVIKLEERRPIQVPPLALIKDDIRQELMVRAEDEYIKRLLDVAEVERFDMDGKPVAPVTVQ